MWGDQYRKSLSLRLELFFFVALGLNLMINRWRMANFMGTFSAYGFHVCSNFGQLFGEHPIKHAATDIREFY